MSYCRMSEDSDVYVIGVWGKHGRAGWECVGCATLSRRIHSRRDLLRHMIAHLRKGDKVPAYATDRVIKEMAQNRRKGGST
jgi:hypothetical protein